MTEPWSLPTANPGVCVIGYLDRIENGEIAGWALDTEHPEAPVMVTVCVDGLPLCEALAVHYRPDVAAVFGCRGLSGFYIDLAKYCAPGRYANVELRLFDGTYITKHPIAVDVPERPCWPEDPILIMHIPKTAGTSLREAAADSYLASEVAYLYPDPPGIPGSDLRPLPLEQRARLRCVIGHFRFGTHTLLPRPGVYATLVRDPVERVISHYKHLAKVAPELVSDGGRLLSIEEAVQRRIICDFDNLLVRYFAGVDDTLVPAGQLTRTHYERAASSLKSQFIFVGHQEHAQAAFDTMSSLFGWRPVQIGSSMMSAIETASLGRPEEIREIIRAVNTWDLELYRDILEQFPMPRAADRLRRGVSATVPVN